jgi:hypothetical protein
VITENVLVVDSELFSVQPTEVECQPAGECLCVEF